MTSVTSEDLLSQEPLDVDTDEAPEVSARQKAVLDVLGDIESNKVTPKAVHDTGEDVDATSVPATASIDAKIEQAKRDLNSLSSNTVAAYRDRLKDNDIKETTARDIVDTLLVQLQTYQRSYKILNGKVTIVLRTRSAGDQRKIHAEVQREGHKLNAAYDTHVSLLHTAFSFVFNDTATTEKTFNHESSGADDAGWKSALAFLQSIPAPTLMLVQAKVYEFETLISVVMSEGFEENF